MGKQGLKGSTNASVNSTNISIAQTADLGQPSSNREGDNSTGIVWSETEALALVQRRHPHMLACNPTLWWGQTDRKAVRVHCSPA